MRLLTLVLEPKVLVAIHEGNMRKIELKPSSKTRVKSTGGLARKQQVFATRNLSLTRKH